MAGKKRKGKKAVKRRAGARKGRLSLALQIRKKKAGKKSGLGRGKKRLQRRLEKTRPGGNPEHAAFGKGIRHRRKNTNPAKNLLVWEMPKNKVRKRELQSLAQIRKRQGKIWAWTITLAIFLFFIIFVIEFGTWMNWWHGPGERQLEIMEQADMLAIGVLGIDIFGRFRVARNKRAFLRHNWLEIIAILPMGLVFKMGRVLESLEFLKVFQVAVKVEEMAVIMPSLGFARGTRFVQFVAHFEKIALGLSEVTGQVIKLFVDLERAFLGSEQASEVIFRGMKVLRKFLK